MFTAGASLSLLLVGVKADSIIFLPHLIKCVCSYKTCEDLQFLFFFKMSLFIIHLLIHVHKGQLTTRNSFISIYFWI